VNITLMTSFLRMRGAVTLSGRAVARLHNFRPDASFRSTSPCSKGLKVSDQIRNFLIGKRRSDRIHGTASFHGLFADHFNVVFLMLSSIGQCVRGPMKQIF
jgi:hypothetical protein